jgi:hypothetical protein
MSTKIHTLPRGDQAEKLLISLHRYHNDSKFRQQKEEAMMLSTDGHVTFKEVLDLHIKNFIANGQPKAVRAAKEKEEVPAPGKTKKNIPWADGLKALLGSNGNHPLTARAILNTLCKDRSKGKKSKKRLYHCLWLYCKAGWLKKDKESGKYSLNKNHSSLNTL